MHCYCKYLFAIALGLAAIFLLRETPAVSSWSIGLMCGSPNLSSLLHQVWCWFGLNKDSIGSIVQVMGVIGIVFAARTFSRTQKLNQANAVFQLMKEARDLVLKLNPPQGGQPLEERRKLTLGMNFHASIFQYRHLDFIDDVSWKPFEDDLEVHMRDQNFVNWLYGRQNSLGLTAAAKFDPRFIAYLKTIHQRATASSP